MCIAFKADWKICSLRMYNSLVEKCFRDCIDSFRRKDLDNTEERVCILFNSALHLSNWNNEHLPQISCKYVTNDPV